MGGYLASVRVWSKYAGIGELLHQLGDPGIHLLCGASLAPGPSSLGCRRGDEASRKAGAAKTPGRGRPNNGGAIAAVAMPGGWTVLRRLSQPAARGSAQGAISDAGGSALEQRT